METLHHLPENRAAGMISEPPSPCQFGEQDNMQCQHLQGNLRGFHMALTPNFHSQDARNLLCSFRKTQPKRNAVGLFPVRRSRATYGEGPGNRWWHWFSLTTCQYTRKSTQTSSKINAVGRSVEVCFASFPTPSIQSGWDINCFYSKYSQPSF